MATTIYGVLGLNDNDNVALNTFGQDVIYDAVQQVLAQHNADVEAASSVFIERQTENHTLLYKLPGGGRLQKLGGKAQAGAVKASGEWSVSFPLEDFGDQIAADRIAYAYMNTEALQRHLNTVMIRNVNTVRYEILRAILHGASRTFKDELYGDLTIQPLASGDSVVYPPVLGAEDGATENHYLVSGYDATAISDANNPYETLANELEEHFGAPSGGSNLVAFIHHDEVAETKALADFDEVPDRFVRPGNDTAVPEGLPANTPGRIIGRVSGMWVSEWRWVPSGYIVAMHLDAPKPLIQRVDPTFTGLPRGLQLVAESDRYPFTQSHYEHRFGVGVGNRLNGVVMQLTTNASYSAPSGY